MKNEYKMIRFVVENYSLHEIELVYTILMNAVVPMDDFDALKELQDFVRHAIIEKLSE